MKRFYFSLALVCLLAGTLWAADDPFCGKWKLNMEKSKFAGEQSKIEDLGGNKYKWTSGNVSDTITADGTEQTGLELGKGRDRQARTDGAATARGPTLRASQQPRWTRRTRRGTYSLTRHS